ncbi:MAG: hypothetical protein ACSHWU_00930 [Marinicella sp.]
MKQVIGMFFMLCVVPNAWSVQQNHNGKGEVLIYPYYTVNNNLNTLYSVVNTTPDSKAIRLRFLEGDIGLEVLSFNVYLSAYDVWTGALVPATSTVLDHVGEPSAIHVTADQSCAPFLNKAGQELLPFIIDTDLDTDNLSMQRATEGYLEIYEMGVLTGEAIAWVDQNGIGVPANCASIAADWSDDETWSFGELDGASGGLIGAGSIVNVAEGIAFPFDAITLQDFWQGTEIHTSPGSTLPDLSSAFPESTVMLDDGGVSVSTWEHGFQAVSAVLTHTQVTNEYSLEQFINGKTEWVVNFPTKNLHSTGAEVVAPFMSPWDGIHACETVTWSLWDRESTYQNEPICIGSPCPPRPLNPALCQSTNVLDFYLPSGSPTVPTAVLGSQNQLSVFVGSTGFTESGWAVLDFPETGPSVPETGQALFGLPVIGFAVQQFTNAGAAEGLLAQYGSLFKHKYSIDVESDN